MIQDTTQNINKKNKGKLGRINLVRCKLCEMLWTGKKEVHVEFMWNKSVFINKAIIMFVILTFVEFTFIQVLFPIIKQHCKMFPKSVFNVMCLFKRN